jgi:hypothetical protein
MQRTDKYTFAERLDDFCMYVGWVVLVGIILGILLLGCQAAFAQKAPAPKIITPVGQNYCQTPEGFWQECNVVPTNIDVLQGVEYQAFNVMEH